MLVVFELNGKQYDGYIGEDVQVDLLEKPEADMKIDKVLVFKNSDEDVLVGQPYVPGAILNAKHVRDFKDKKVIVFKFKIRKKYRRKQGHRQQYSVIHLTGINVGGKEIKEEKKASVQKTEKKVEKVAKAE